jgi:predicted ATPase
VELVYQRGLVPQATYLFKHALIQDTAYHSLLKSKRQQYHQRIAQVLEERFLETKEALRGKRWVKVGGGWPKNGLKAGIIEIFKGLKT